MQSAGVGSGGCFWTSECEAGARHVLPGEAAGDPADLSHLLERCVKRDVIDLHEMCEADASRVQTMPPHRWRALGDHARREGHRIRRVAIGRHIRLDAHVAGALGELSFLQELEIPQGRMLTQDELRAMATFAPDVRLVFADGARVLEEPPRPTVANLATVECATLAAKLADNYDEPDFAEAVRGALSRLIDLSAQLQPRNLDRLFAGLLRDAIETRDSDFLIAYVEAVGSAASSQRIGRVDALALLQPRVAPVELRAWHPLEKAAPILNAAGAALDATSHDSNRGFSGMPLLARICLKKRDWREGLSQPLPSGYIGLATFTSLVLASPHLTSDEQIEIVASRFTYFPPGRKKRVAAGQPASVFSSAAQHGMDLGHICVPMGLLDAINANGGSLRKKADLLKALGLNWPRLVLQLTQLNRDPDLAWPAAALAVLSASMKALFLGEGEGFVSVRDPVVAGRCRDEGLRAIDHSVTDGGATCIVICTSLRPIEELSHFEDPDNPLRYEIPLDALIPLDDDGNPPPPDKDWCRPACMVGDRAARAWHWPTPVELGGPKVEKSCADENLRAADFALSPGRGLLVVCASDRPIPRLRHYQLGADQVDPSSAAAISGGIYAIPAGNLRLRAVADEGDAAD